MKLFKEWKRYLLLLALILGIGFFLRVFNLVNLPIFADEAIYVRWAQVMRVEPGLRFLPLSDGKQPLFMWSVIPFLKVFEDPLFAGRFLSALTGVGTAIGIFVATYLLFNSKKAAFFAGLIYALTPFSVFFDRMALVDSMLTFWGAWTFVGAVLVAKTKRLDFALLAGFTLGFALLTKSPALFFVLLLPSTLLVTKFPKGRKKRLTHLIKLGLLWGVSVVIGYGMYNIQRLGPNFHLIAQRNLDYVYPVSWVLKSPLDPLLPFLSRIFQYFYILGPSILIALVLFGVFVGFKKYRNEVLLVGLWGLFPLVTVAEYSQTMTARYVLFTLPFFVILASLGTLSNKEVFRKIFIGGLIIFVFHSLLINRHLLTNVEAANLPRSERSGYLEEWTAGVGIREVADYIEEYHQDNPGEKIVVGTEGYFGTLPDGLQIHLNDEPKITVIGVGVNLDRIPESLIESKMSGNKTFLVINNSRLRLKPEKFGLEHIAVYPKAVKPDGSRETLLLLEVTEDTLRIQEELGSN